MPIRLTRSDFRIIVIAAVVSLVSLAIGVRYFGRAFPEASLDLRISREGSRPIAEKFLRDRGLEVSGYRHAAIFDYDEQAKVYLERTQGLERMDKLARGPVRMWRWSHRWFLPQQQEEFRVEVTPTGEIAGFRHEIPEGAPGADLLAEEARSRAESLLADTMRWQLSDLDFVEGETQKRPARTDHRFTWEDRRVELGDGSHRVAVSVAGERIAGYAEFIKIPEQWQREYANLRARNQSAQLVAQIFFFLLTVAMLVVLVLRLRDRDVPLRLSVILGLVGGGLFFLGQLNNLPLAEFSYRTTDSYASFMAGHLRQAFLAALAVGAVVFFVVAAGEPVYREHYAKHVSLRGFLSRTGVRTKAFFISSVIAIALTFFFFAYQTVFYLLAGKLGAWAPADVNYSDLLNTKIPWVWVLFIGFLPAVSEEMQFRAFAIPFLRKLLRSKWAALILAAFVWGFLHSGYPNQPFFIRGIEVGIGGIVIGLIMLRFGILAPLIWHYSVDAIYTAFLLLRSDNTYFIVSGLVTAGIMLIPFALALGAYLRKGTFEDESPLTHEAVGVSRAPKRETPREPETPLAYRSLSPRRLKLAALVAAAGVALSLIPADRFGKSTKVQITRREAQRAADEFLRERQRDPASYRRVAWLHENVDRMALRYLLEHRSVAEADRLYREATKLLLWQVRYFRPREKEEHWVFVDPAGGRVFSYRHILDENAPGAELSPEQARALAEKFLRYEGYRLNEFELRDSQAIKRPARMDSELVWEARDTPESRWRVEDARLRLEVQISGGEVSGLARYFKTPEEWQRARQATRLHHTLLGLAATLLVMGAVAGIVYLLVIQIRRGAIEWRRAVRAGIAAFLILLLARVNQLPTLEREFDTAEPTASFVISVLFQMLVFPLLGGLLAWLLVGLAASLRPEVWRVFRASGRRVWRRDAAVALGVALAVFAGIEQVQGWVAMKFHAHVAPQVELVPALFDSFSPAVAHFLRGLILALLLPALAAVLIHLVGQAVARRLWWLWPAGALILVSLGPAGAQSARESFVGWTMGFIAVAALIGVVIAFFRENVMAYVLVAFAFPVAQPLYALWQQEAGFYRTNGVLLALLAALVFFWALRGGREAAPASGDAARQDPLTPQ